MNVVLVDGHPGAHSDLDLVFSNREEVGGSFLAEPFR